MMSFGTVLQNGNRYLKCWPVKSELNGLFPENRVVMITRFAIQLMPAIAVLTLVLPMVFERAELLPQALFMALLFISLPLHGLVWLERRAITPLPVSLVNWYKEIQQRLEQHGESAPYQSTLRYMELAVLLNIAFKTLDRGFLFE